MSLMSIFLMPIYFAVTLGVDNENLIAFVQIFRHGERSPFLHYNNDPHKTHWGDLEPGQLTKEGRRQLYQLGQLTRQRYADWIPTKYKKNFFRAHTTDTDRTHMSGQAYLFGLFPATGDQTWLPNVNWQPIPLHLTDPAVVWDNPVCPAYWPLVEKVRAMEKFAKVNEYYADMYDYISGHCGNNVTNLERGLILYSCLEIEKGAGLTLPEWTQSVFPQPLRAVSGLYFKSLVYTVQLKRLFVGLFLKEVLDYFDNMTVNASLYPKIQIYSAHDANIAAILECFGAFENPFPPDFASTIWIELRRNSSSYYVNAWNKNGEDFTQISINGCELDCPLEKVRASLDEIILDKDKWNSECNSIS